MLNFLMGAMKEMPAEGGGEDGGVGEGVGEGVGGGVGEGGGEGEGVLLGDMVSTPAATDPPEASVAGDEVGTGGGPLSSPSDSIDSAQDPPQEEAPSPFSPFMQEEAPSGSFSFMSDAPPGLAGPSHSFSSSSSSSFQLINTTPPADVDYLHYPQGEQKDSGGGDRDEDGDGDEEDTNDPYSVDGESILRGLIVQPTDAPPAGESDIGSVQSQSSLGPSRSQVKVAAKLLGKPLKKKELKKFDPQQQTAPTNPNQCSRVFILKVLSSLADYLRSFNKNRRIKDIHCIGREARLVQDCFQAARHDCCLPTLLEEWELYGGLKYIDGHHTNWTEAWQLVSWWENNVEHGFEAMQRDARAVGNLKATQKARWSHAVVEHCTTIRSAMTPLPANAPSGPLPTARAAPKTTTATGHTAATTRFASASASVSASYAIDQGTYGPGGSWGDDGEGRDFMDARDREGVNQSGGRGDRGGQGRGRGAVGGRGRVRPGRGEKRVPYAAGSDSVSLTEEKGDEPVTTQGHANSASSSPPQGPIDAPPTGESDMGSIQSQSSLGPSRSQVKAAAKLGKKQSHREDDSDEVQRLIASSKPFISLGDPADVAEVYKVLPLHMQEYLHRLDAHSEALNLVEVVMDLGRTPYFYHCPASQSQGGFVMLREVMDGLVSAADLALVTAAVGPFSEADNRAGIDKTLHRVSRRLNRSGDVIGLTLRLGRSVPGMYLLLQSELEQGKSVLLVGCPGAGKTTLLRDCACFLARTKRVEIVDTSNEIAGNGDIPHAAIGLARRMMVPVRAQQHRTMLEAVQNHTPEAMVIDEIGSAQEVMAAIDVEGRGVQLLATVHGTTISDVANSPILGRLLGGLHTVLLSAGEVVERGAAGKSVRERKGVSCFDVVVEIHKTACCVVISDANQCVDRLLNNLAFDAELRVLESETHVSTVPLRVRAPPLI